MTSMYTALEYARLKHGDQKRKYTGDPYIVHPVAVQNTLFFLNAPRYVLEAAVLHDTIEDTDATFEDIESKFGKEVALLVSEVTDASGPLDGNRAARKKIDLKHLSTSTYWGASIKLADLIDNSRTIVFHDPNFAKVYLKEKEATLAVLQHGHPLLIQYAYDILNFSFKILGTK